MLLKEFGEKKKMKKILLFVILTSLSLAQAPNLFYTYLTTGVNSTDTTLYFTATDTTFAGNGTSYYATIWDTWYANASDAFKANKAEIVLINSRSGRTFDVERAQLSTTARSFNTSGRRYRIDVASYSSSLLPAISASTSGKYLLSGSSTSSWSSALPDSNTVYRTAINKSVDSIAVHRTEINTLTSLDSVDIPYVTTFGGSSMGSQTTLYAGIGGAQLATAEASVTYAPFGISGRVIAMYFQSKTNSCTSTPTITFQYGDTSASSLSASSITITPALNQKYKAVTGQTQIITPSTLGGFKYVNSSGSGTITFPTVTLIVRTKLN